MHKKSTISHKIKKFTRNRLEKVSCPDPDFAPEGPQVTSASSIVCHIGRVANGHPTRFGLDNPFFAVRPDGILASPAKLKNYMILSKTG